MKNLQIDEKNALQLYGSASPEFKAMLHDTFGEKFFQQKITDRVKTFEDACAAVGENPERSLFSYGAPDEIAYRKLKVIVYALNEGWEPNWDDEDEQKFYPWFYMSPSGFRLYNVRYGFARSGVGFRLYNVRYGFARSGVGSRLCFRTRELAEYAAVQFVDLYKQFLTS